MMFIRWFLPGAVESHHNAFMFSADVLPFLPTTSSYPTFWPSFRVARPAFSTADTCTKTSFEPSSGPVRQTEVYSNVRPSRGAPQRRPPFRLLVEVAGVEPASASPLQSGL